MLSKGKATFDIVIANINSPDFYGFKLLQQATKMDLLVMLMLDNEDAATMAKGLEEGAFLCVTKPITMDTVKYLWQHVLREKIWKLKAHRRYGRTAIYDNGFGEEGSEVYMAFENDEEKYHLKGYARGERIRNEDEVSDIEDDMNPGFMKRKVWTEWTEELHEKFVDAVMQLGEGRCYPKEILDLMNVPGLTRMQVASHLQKCRGGTWLPPNERKYKTGSPGSSSPKEARAPRSRTRRFGSMPIVGINPHDNQEVNQEKSTLDHEELYVNSSVGDNSTTSSDAEGYRPHIQPQDGYNNIPYGHVENNAGELNMWHLGLSLGMDDSYMSGERFLYGDQVMAGNGVGSGSLSHQGNNARGDTFEFRNGDFMVRNSSASQQEVGANNYNGNLHALDLEQLYSMQIPGVADVRNGQRIHEESGSVGYSKEGQR
ncbi:hypothetical protein F511_07713 [Dorcoceras hygrometricum]|uniref:Uncharacterized protein n=1 Tax=Dorcoceras hygrometricum TaxID=472368 RepID=A0A2Z7CJK3_9LAMI|nr:hypothetical protein F511_07713 [Dorcoceras hygrometricum]